MGLLLFWHGLPASASYTTVYHAARRPLAFKAPRRSLAFKADRRPLTFKSERRR